MKQQTMGRVLAGLALSLAYLAIGTASALAGAWLGAQVAQAMLGQPLPVNPFKPWPWDYLRAETEAARFEAGQAFQPLALSWDRESAAPVLKHPSGPSWH